jgi:alpha-2-macroglobulin
MKGQDFHPRGIHLSRWYFLPIILLIVLVSCKWQLPAFPTLSISPTASPTAAPTAIPLPPTIVETVPPIGSEIQLQSLLTIYFSEKMNRLSVETGLTADFPGGFIFSWVDDSTLTLAPRSPMPSGARVTFTLADSVHSTSSLPVLAPITFSYTTPGPLRVSQVLPSPQAQDASPDSAVVVTFDQPVVALGADPASLPAGFSLNPSTPGKGEWLNTSTYIFHAAPALFGGVQYDVQVNPSLLSTSGMPLDPSGANVSWSFNTSLPVVEHIAGVEPDAVASEGSDLFPDSLIEVAFNQSMDKASVESNFSFTGPSGRIAGEFTWNDKSSLVTFKPSVVLERSTEYSVFLGREAHSIGGASIGSDTRQALHSIPPFAVQSTSFPSGDLRPQYSNIAFYFTAPIAKYSNSEISDLLTIEPASPSKGFYINSGTLYNYGSFLPGRQYSITVSPHLKDLFGQELGQAYVFSFIQPDAQPDLQPTTYQSVLFTLPADPNISVQAVNLNSVDVSRGSISLEDVLRIGRDYDFSNTYSSPDKTSWTIYPNLPRNNNQTLSLTLSDTPLATGFYYITYRSPDVPNNYSNVKILAVSNVNLTFKMSATEALVWAVDLRTHEPVANMPVRLFNTAGVNYISGVTGIDGLWRGQFSSPQLLDYTSTNFAVLGNPGDDQFGVANAKWNNGVDTWSFGLANNFSGPVPDAYLYTDRPIYRPGDTVHLRGIVRQAYDGRYSNSAIQNVKVKWYDPAGGSGEQAVALSSYGSFNYDLALPAGAVPGYYSFLVFNNDQEISGGSLYFNVADYRKPEINLSLEINPAAIKNGQPLSALVKAEYFFGSPVPDLDFKWSLYNRRSYFTIPEFVTGLQISGWLPLGNGGRFGYISREGEGRTNADGTFSLNLDDIQVDDTSTITLEVTATESGGFPVSARADVTLHPENFYIGVRPDLWVGQAGSSLGFDILSVDWDEKPVSRTINVAFEKVRWERQDAGDGEFTFKPIYTPLYSKTVSTTGEGSARVNFTPPDAGTYVLDVLSGDAHTQALVWVSGADAALWPNLPYQRLDLTADRQDYKPGDSASVFIPNPFDSPALALLTTERSTIKSVQVVEIPVQGYQFAIPLTDVSAPNVYVSATLLDPVGVDFRQGYLNLPVDSSSLVLNVALKATPAKARPGDTLALDLVVTDSKGHPVQGEFSLAVVDLAVLALADPNSQEIVPAYYSNQPLGVSTGLTAAQYTHRVFYEPGGRGGGGGGAPVITLRSNFPDTTYWKADIVTDSQGKAHLSFTLPDNLTTWQVDVRGLNASTQVGQALLHVVSTKDLLIRPQTQRFFVTGDHAELAAIVNNNTGQPLQATARLEVNGFTLDDPSEAGQQLTIAAHGSVRVAWVGTVQAVDAVDPIFSVTSTSLQDAARPNDGPIPVLRYSAPQTFSTSGVLSGVSTHQEIIAVPRSFLPLGGNLKLELAPSMASVILSSLKSLESSETPWSSEQIMSSLLPNMVTYRLLADSGLTDADLSSRLQANISSDLLRLLSYQAEDGGFKWTLSSLQSDPYLTSYVLFGLQQAASVGLDLGAANIADAVEKARTYLISTWSNLGESAMDTPAGVNRLAFTLFVLENTGGLGSLYNLPDLLYNPNNLDRLDPWARALLALTLYSRSTLAVDQRVPTLLDDLEATAIRTASGAHWESAGGDWMDPSTPLTTTAMVIFALADRDPSTPLLADAVRYLAIQQNPNGRWSSSYETSWVILALDKYLQASGDLGGNFSFSAALNGLSLAQGQASGLGNLASVTAQVPLTGLNLSAANSLLVSRAEGPGSLYYRASLSIDRPVESAPVINNGIAVSRQFLDCSSDPCRTIISYQVKPDLSGRISVRLTITMPDDAYNLLVQDYIPAGADILDSSLNTSQQGQQDMDIQSLIDPSDPFKNGWGWWYFNQPQIYADHILWSADYLPAGTYELTYTIIPSLAGNYHLLPAHAWQAYFPEVQGTSAGAVFEIKP